MIFCSSIPDVDIPDIDLPAFMLEYSAKSNIFGDNPNHVALIDENTELTFAEFNRLSHQFASGLSNNLGVKRGDIVAVILPNSVLYPVVTLGVQMIGGVCATINPSYNAHELAYYLELVKPQVIIAENTKIQTINESLTNLAIPQIIALENIESIYSDKSFARIRLTTESKTTTAFIVFSSGTTGMPKGVQISHHNLISNILQTSAHMNSDTLLSSKLINKTMICALPMFHMLALSCMLHFGLHNGFRIVIMRRFDLERFCAVSQKYSATFARVVPPIVLGIAKHPIVANYDLSSYAAIVSSASPLPNDLQIAAQLRIGTQIVQESGMSEASGNLTATITSQSISGSCGTLLPNTMAKVIDDSGNVLGPGDVGELCFKSPSVMLGYINNAHATHSTIDSDGYLHTGDFGYFDDGGNCFIISCKRELIRYKGFQVVPAELETILASHPAVVDCAVIAVYDSECASEVPKAFVDVRKEHVSPSLADEIREWVDGLVVGYKRLRGGVEIVDEIPKSNNGKTLRRMLREREEMKRPVE